MKKILPIIVILVVVGAGYYLFTKDQSPEELESVRQGTGQGEERELADNSRPTDDSTEPTSTPEVTTQPPSNPPPKPGTTFSSGAEVEAGMSPDILVTEVVYDGATFSPQTTNIKVGDIVIFKNMSVENFWPASAPHPTHTDYPEFDAQKALGPGKSFQFKFQKSGSWKFHDHMNPSAIGTINVSE